MGAPAIEKPVKERKIVPGLVFDGKSETIRHFDVRCPYCGEMNRYIIWKKLLWCAKCKKKFLNHG